MVQEVLQNKDNELQKVRERYLRRSQSSKADLYNPLDPSYYMTLQEKERAFIYWIKKSGLSPVKDKRLLEIGCGQGDNLIQFLRLGFRPENLVGNELLEERALIAQHRLPSSIQILIGDASVLDLPENSFDVVFQSLVFTSIFDDEFQKRLANRMWSMVKLGGYILWYDFIFNNPNNPDVRGVPIRRIKELFPERIIKVCRLTLAPPISRCVTKIHPCLYTLFNLFPFMRTHILCWIKKNR